MARRRSRVSASSGFLSVRQREIRGKRTATPDCAGATRRCLRRRPRRPAPARPSAPARSVCTRVAPDPGVERADLLVREPRVGLGERHQLGAVPDREGVVGEQVGPAAVAGLGVDQHGVDVEGVELPFPPVPAPPAGAVGRVEALEHQPLGPLLAGRLVARPRQLLPGRALHRRGDQEEGPAASQLIPQYPFQPRPPLLQGPLAQVGSTLSPGGRRPPAPPGLRPGCGRSASCGRCGAAAPRTAAAPLREKPGSRRPGRCRPGAARPRPAPAPESAR